MKVSQSSTTSINASVQQRQTMINRIGEMLSFAIDLPIQSSAKLRKNGMADVIFFFTDDRDRVREAMHMRQVAPSRYDIALTDFLLRKMEITPAVGLERNGISQILTGAAKDAGIKDAWFSFEERSEAMVRHAPPGGGAATTA
ncbi:MAG: hypothetical protein LVQ95_00550 [Candidatus Micrarchaeales archaeon]|nr:hypothetical protein [Candidatus Micrarchaeales archaeon]